MWSIASDTLSASESFPVFALFVFVALLSVDAVMAAQQIACFPLGYACGHVMGHGGVCVLGAISGCLAQDGFGLI